MNEIKNGFKIPKNTYFKGISSFIENFHLKLNKFAYFKDGYKIQNQKINEDFFDKNWGFYFDRICSYYSNIQKLNLNFYKKAFKTTYRLVVGAEESVYETSLRLHHIYGIPYIPASAIKGNVRSYIIQEQYQNNENKAIKNEKFNQWFGSQEKEGEIIFFDAFPISKPKIKVDVITPHYKEYYEGKKPPTDDQKVVPINFLTLEDSEFLFLIGSKNNIDNDFIEFFKNALIEFGIGSKKSVGCGYFKN